MIVVNTTFHVETAVEREWVAWIHATYLAMAVATGVMYSPLFMRIRSHVEGGTAYALQMQAESESDAERWLDDIQPKLLTEMYSHWGERVLYFTTIMDEVKLWP
ncbi:MAG: DUF4286 family protein [Muribaculum sp.]|nr:DUF4286 family protein [Muribaculum sp.]